MDAISSMPLSCPCCAARMPQTAAFCPGCGIAMKDPVRGQGKVGVLPESIAAGLAYLTFVPAIIFLVARPYNRNLFLRFHSVQSLLYCAATMFAATVLRLLGFLLGMIPTAGPLMVAILYVLGIFAAIILWAVLFVKALQAEQFKLPVLGEFAEKYAALP